jgi:hypothetical protein
VLPTVSRSCRLEIVARGTSSYKRGPDFRSKNGTDNYYYVIYFSTVDPQRGPDSVPPGGTNIRTA